MRHQEFLAGVATRGGFERTEDARTGADAVLATLADHLPTDDRRALADALPTLLENESGVDAAGRGAGAPSAADLVDEVARRTGWPAERARYALVAVVGQLTAEDAGIGGRLAHVVPAELVDASDPAVPPDVASESSQGRPQPVTADDLARRLDRLVDWSGDVSGVERTIELPSEQIDLLLDRIHRVEAQTAARTRIVDRQPTTLTVRVRTESLGVVTDIDLILAERIDDAVAAVGSAG